MKKRATKGNILHIADYGGPYAGNFISSLLHLKETVSEELGFGTVFVFSKIAEGRPWLKLVQEKGIPVLFVDKRMPLLKRFRTLTAIAKEHNAILLHSHFTLFDIDTAFAAKHLGIKAVWHMHSDLVGNYTLKQWMKDIIKMRIIANRYVDCIIPVSGSVAQFAKRRGVHSSKIITVYNGIDMARLQRVDERTRFMLRRRYGITEKQRVFLLFGWDPERKGVDLLPKQWHYLKS